MAQAPPDPAGVLDEALDNLVRQFARPLDCLRELVQNSIDAGASRVDVELSWSDAEPGRGVLSITVADGGEGMDEHVIDHELTRMFASSKDGDRTKIGRFGIGFTSVFAIEPDAVLLETGRHGESWALHFHPDRSFDKTRLDELVRGTRITMLKALPVDALPDWRRRIRDTLVFWCEHCRIPVTFADRTTGSGVDGPVADADDPFAVFADPSSATATETLSRPLDCAAARYSVRHQQDGITVVVGIGGEAHPRYSWYAGGLTLLSTTDPSCLGRWADALAPLTLKVESADLEHTLTRDNVLQDAAWERALKVIIHAVARLAQQVLRRHEEAVTSGAPLGDTISALATLAGATPLRDAADRIHLPTLHGPRHSVAHHVPRRLVSFEPAELATASVASPLTQALHRSGAPVLAAHPSLASLLDNLGRPASLISVEGRWWLVQPHTPHPTLAALVSRVAELLQSATGRRQAVGVCTTLGTHTPLCVATAPSDTPVRPDTATPQPGAQRIWVDAEHPTVALAQKVAHVAPDVAAYTVCQGILAETHPLDHPVFSALAQAVVAP